MSTTHNDTIAVLVGRATGCLVTIFDRGLTDGDAETHRLVSEALNSLYAAQRRIEEES